MSRHLLPALIFLTVLSSCASSSVNSGEKKSVNKRSLHNGEAVTTSYYDVDTSFLTSQDFFAGKTPVALTELPRTEDGAFVLSAGYYETNFKTYCLQPGTPGPSNKDAYFQAPLRGARKDIIETVLRNSQKQSNLEQKNIQLLLWSVVSHSDFNKLTTDVQSTAYHLLSPKQIFELKGGVVGAVKAVAQVIPGSNAKNQILNLFEVGVTSYESYERLAVLPGTSEISRPDFKRDQWLRHSDGYYVRYMPNSYKETKVQVYVPENITKTTSTDSANYIIFDPTSLVVVPANSNAQRLGIGAPVIDIVKSVIKVIGTKKKTEAPKETPRPAPAGHPGT